MEQKVNAQSIQKISFIANAALMGYVICMMFLYRAYHVNYMVVHGPFYEITRQCTVVVLCMNSISVFLFLISYTSLSIKMIIRSQEELTKMAQVDRLTGLYNRHFMISHLESLSEEIDSKYWLAMLDIDNFKKFNDTYGHDCGDYVLVHVCELMQEICKDCTISRWGGEEFLISSCTQKVPIQVLEDLRKKIAVTEFIYEGQALQVTVTIGVAAYQKGHKLDQWIQDADSKLYHGKNHGKNQVVQEY